MRLFSCCPSVFSTGNSNNLAGSDQTTWSVPNQKQSKLLCALIRSLRESSNGQMQSQNIKHYRFGQWYQPHTKIYELAAQKASIHTHFLLFWWNLIASINISFSFLWIWPNSFSILNAQKRFATFITGFLPLRCSQILLLWQNLF